MTEIGKEIRKTKLNFEQIIDPDFIKVSEIEQILKTFYGNKKESIRLCLEAVFTWQFLYDFSGLPIERSGKSNYDFTFNRYNKSWKVSDLFSMSVRELENVRAEFAGTWNTSTFNYHFKKTDGSLSVN